jgi:hypothetical protein
MPLPTSVPEARYPHLGRKSIPGIASAFGSQLPQLIKKALSTKRDLHILQIPVKYFRYCILSALGIRPCHSASGGRPEKYSRQPNVI